LNFKSQSIPFFFQEAILKNLENQNSSELDASFKKIIQWLPKKINYPIFQDFLVICYRHGLDVEKDERKSKFLEGQLHIYFLDLKRKYLKNKLLP